MSATRWSNRDSKKRVVAGIPSTGVMHINSTTKNLNIAVTDLKGRVYNFISGGLMGQKNFKKKTATVVEEMIVRITRESYDRGLRNVHIKVKGFCYNRNIALRQMGSMTHINVLTLSDVTPIPHGGCLPKKARRK